MGRTIFCPQRKSLFKSCIIKNITKGFEFKHEVKKNTVKKIKSKGSYFLLCNAIIGSPKV